MICEGGLFSCVRCHGAEGSLPTECPGFPMLEWNSDAVMTGLIDFKRGRWVVVPNKERQG